MANPKILYQDLSLMTPSSSFGTDASYPVTNLQNYIASSYWKSNNTASVQWVTFDFGSPVSSSAVVIDGCNFASVAADNGILFQGANVVDFTGATTLATGLNALADDVTAYYTYTANAYRYYRLYFDASAPMGTYPRIGNVFIGQPLEFTTPYTYGYKTENAEYKTNEFITLSGIKRTVQSYKGRIVYELKFNLQNSAFATAFKTFVRTVRGKMRPFYFIDTDETTVRYMNLDSDYVPVSVPHYGFANVESIVMKTNESTF